MVGKKVYLRRFDCVPCGILRDVHSQTSCEISGTYDCNGRAKTQQLPHKHSRSNDASQLCSLVGEIAPNSQHVQHGRLGILNCSSEVKGRGHFHSVGEGLDCALDNLTISRNWG